MNAATRLRWLTAWLQQALAVADGRACGIGVLARTPIAGSTSHGGRAV
jgi:hypothetical protein